MAYDEAAARRVRQALSGRSGVTETRMMGALVFLLHGHMCCGVTGAALMVRIGEGAREEALSRPHVRPMEVGGRRPRAFVAVEPEGYATDAALADWVERGVAYAASLPPKDATAKAHRRARM